VVLEHDVPLLRATCDRFIGRDAGHIIAAGTSVDVLDDPAVVRGYLGGAAPVAA
jgi:ABC-type branched-subunit amino acid transport system ATPase component